MKKINKNTARRLFDERKPFLMVASKLRPEHGIWIDESRYQKLNGGSFESLMAAFQYFNGKSVAFYVN